MKKPFRGWTITWALAVTQTVGYGVLLYTFGVVTVPMEEALGLSRAGTSLAFSVALLATGMAAWFMGRWVDQYGGRGVMTLGSIAASLLVLAWSLVQNLPQLLLVQIGIGVAMAAVTYDVAFTVIARWFRQHRIRAMMVVTLLAGLASTIFIPLATFLVDLWGWRTALQLLAGVLFLTTVPLHAITLRRDPIDVGQHPDGVSQPARPRVGESEPTTSLRDAMRSRVFWWMTGSFAFDQMVFISIAAHSVPLLLERGFEATLVAGAAGSIGVMQVVGRVVFAPATRYWSLRRLAIATYTVRAVALVALWLGPGLMGLVVFVLTFGLANGASTLARAGLVGEVYGVRHYGAINGAMTGVIALLQTVAPLLVGFLRSATGRYDEALVMLLALSITSAIATGRLPLRVPQRLANERV